MKAFLTYSNRRFITLSGYLLVIFCSLLIHNQVLAQQCDNSTVKILVGFVDGPSPTDPMPVCVTVPTTVPHTFNNIAGGVALFGTRVTCPTTQASCGTGFLASRNHSNTDNFGNAGICLFEYTYGSDPGNETTWNYKQPKHVYVRYTVPKGVATCIRNFSFDFISNNLSTMRNYGVTVIRDFTKIYETSGALNVPQSINVDFGNDPNFCTDGNKEVVFYVYFGAYNAVETSHVEVESIGIKNVRIKGTCGEPLPTALATPATCTASGAANSDASLVLYNFKTGNKYDYSVGNAYTGGATYASGSTVIPADGTIASNLPNPSAPQEYTIRIFNATCYQDVHVTVNPVTCPVACTVPSGGALSVTKASCAGKSASANASIRVTGVTGGDKVNISAGSTYTGPNYDNSPSLSGGAYTFQNLVNPTGTQTYTVRVFNQADDCYTDYRTTLSEQVCSCQHLPFEIVKVDELDPDSHPNNTISTEDDIAIAEICKGTGYVDLKLTKTVSPNVGTTCPINTDITWKVVVTNEGTMPATDISVAEFLPEGLHYVSHTATRGTWGLRLSWIIDHLDPQESAELTIISKPLRAGIFTNCSQVFEMTPNIDIDSTPGDGFNSQDDNACASVTVTGPSLPTLEKEFSPMIVAPNSESRLTIRIINNESFPISLTDPLIDNLPSSPSQMRLASNPDLITNLSGVIVSPNGTTITVPVGTTLLPGINTIQVIVVAPPLVNPAGDIYPNIFAPNALQTQSCGNIAEVMGCLIVQPGTITAPAISKKIEPQVIQVNQNATLTLDLYNPNSSSLVLTSDFYDEFPAGLISNSSASSSCGILVSYITDPFDNTRKALLIPKGTSVPAGHCYITIPVTSTTTGRYCNIIGPGTLMGVVNGIERFNTGMATACVEVKDQPCTSIDITSITANKSGGVIDLTANGTGFSNMTLFNWTSTLGTFNPQAQTTKWTAPSTAGTYTLNVSADNKLTGYGTCVDNASITVTVCSVPNCVGITVIKRE